jgi:hypothetical protein
VAARAIKVEMIRQFIPEDQKGNSEGLGVHPSPVDETIVFAVLSGKLKFLFLL